MGQFNLSMQGKNVRIGLAGVFTNRFTSSIGLGLFDDQNNPVTLLPTERLIIDSLQGAVTVAPADIVLSPAGTPTATGPASTYLATVGTPVSGAGFGGLHFNTKEGVPLPRGVVPSLMLPTPSATTVRIDGAGRILEGTTQGVRPDWRELQTAKGNY